MESAQAKINTRYTIYTYVDDVFEHTKDKYISGVAKEAKFETTTQGWYMTLQGSRESLFLGTEKPILQAGDRVKITFEKVQV